MSGQVNQAVLQQVQELWLRNLFGIDGEQSAIDGPVGGIAITDIL